MSCTSLLPSFCDGVLAPGARALRLDASALPAGVYVVRVVGQTFTTTARVSVAR